MGTEEESNSTGTRPTLFPSFPLTTAVGCVEILEKFERGAWRKALQSRFRSTVNIDERMVYQEGWRVQREAGDVGGRRCGVVTEQIREGAELRAKKTIVGARRPGIAGTGAGLARVSPPQNSLCHFDHARKPFFSFGS